MRQLLEQTRQRLKDAGIPDYYSMAQELVCHVFDVSATEIITRNYIPDRSKEALLFEYTQLCASGKPLQYVTKKAYFLDIELYVDHRVLIPRPETEGLADIARQFVDIRRRVGQNTTVLDICTGSGCIGLHLAKHGATVTLSDISRDALDVASWNASALGLEAETVQSDLFDAFAGADSSGADIESAKAATIGTDPEADIDSARSVTPGVASDSVKTDTPGTVPVANTDSPRAASSGSGRKFDIITANPPYIPSSVIPTLDINVRAWEPLNALDGGPHGWELPDRIIAQYDRFLNPGGLFLMEIGDDQGQHFRQLCPGSRIIQDLEGHDRILAIRKMQK